MIWKIHGDATQLFGLHNGMEVTIKRTTGDVDGKIGLFYIDGSSLLRKIDFKSGKPLRLIAGNKNLPDIYPTKFRLIGIVC